MGKMDHVVCSTAAADGDVAGAAHGLGEDEEVVVWGEEEDSAEGEVVEEEEDNEDEGLLLHTPHPKYLGRGPRRPPRPPPPPTPNPPSPLYTLKRRPLPDS
ncbi:uncharacterized protein LOC143285179 [Babylonia areolata]|uniref:uncharacterized protein LOC143285179 n=1 Tax=Babylonia areolata TaxID=304850 RepID=UPI003FD0D41E